MPTTQKTITPDNALKNLYNKISNTDKFAFFSGTFICLLVNMFIYTNTCFVHDSIRMYDNSNGLNNGRLLIGPLFALLNKMQIPWVIGTVTCLLFGLIIVYLAKIFQIKGRINLIILAGIVITSDTVVISHTYFGSVYMYAFSLLMAIMSVYFADKKRYGIIISVVLLLLSIMTYQAFLSCAVCLFIYKMIFDLFNDKNNKERIIQIVKYAFITILSAVLFYLIWQLTLKVFNETVVQSYAYDKAGIGSSLSDFGSRIFNSCRNTLMILFPYYGLNVSYPLKFIVSVLTVLSFVLFAFSQKSVSKILYYFVFCITYVFSVNLMYFLSGSVSYELTTFSYIFPMLGLLYLFENHSDNLKPKFQNKLVWITSVLCIILIAGQTIYANSIYLKMKINYDNAWSYATRIIDRLEQTEGFNKDTKVAVVGYNHETGGSTQNNIEYPQNKDIQYAVNYPSGYKEYNALYVYPSAVTYPKTLQWFITQEMDMDIDIEGNPENLRYDKRIDEMGVFPSSDSVKWIDGTLVVRIGEMPEQ